MENPFKRELENIVIQEGLFSTTPGIAIKQQCYPIEANLKQADYTLGTIAEDTINKSISGNLVSIMKVQNNHTEVLTYIIKILFNQIDEPIKDKLNELLISNNKLIQESPEAKQIDNLLSEVTTIKNQMIESNKLLSELLKRV